MPPLPALRISIGVTGHRSVHSSYPGDDTALRQVLDDVLDKARHLAAAAGAQEPPRLCTLLADGCDQIAAELAVAGGWELLVPLPFGRRLNRAIAALPTGLEQAKHILATGTAPDAAIAAQLDPLIALEQQARIFEIAERDDQIAAMLCAHLADPADGSLARAFLFESGQRFAMAGRVLVEQSDLLVAVWDGQTHAITGGTGDTVRAALHAAVPVLWIDPAQPANWRILTSSEMLACPPLDHVEAGREEQLKALLGSAIGTAPDEGFAALADEPWPGHSTISHHAYRRIETLFGQSGLANRFASIRQVYETPKGIAQGSAAPMLAALGVLDPDQMSLAQRMHGCVIARFAWMDGIATQLSDRHRSSMVINFLLGSAAIIAGVLYLPLGGPDVKWVFASVELLLLLVIVVNTWSARRQDLHSRWFASRRAAEYLRHRPLMLAVGVARPAGQWPHGEKSGWPEHYARHAEREVGLPEAAIDRRWLGQILHALKMLHVVPQRDYHRVKSERLNHVHHALDQVSEALFAAAIIAVAAYLALAAVQALGFMPQHDLTVLSKWFTVAGVAFPTLGGALAGIRYFGDFERFADISQVTAQRLDEIVQRIGLLESVPPEALAYGDVADLLRATDAIVMAELESWQAVFSGKRVAVPV